MRSKPKETPPSSFAVGDRVVPVDRDELWSSKSVELIVTQCDLCKVSAYWGDETIKLRVRWHGRNSFEVWQFAKHYQKYESTPPPVSRLSTNRRER